MICRSAIVAEARDWIGTRWQHQGALKGVGTDCIGLVAGVAMICGIAEAAQFFGDMTARGYGREPDPRMLLASCDRYLAPIGTAAAKRGDIFLMRFVVEPQHFAIISETVPHPYIVHAYAQARKVVENRVDHIWRSRIVRAYQFRGELDG